MSIEEKIAKLETATKEAEAQVNVAREALDVATQQLANCKAKYRNLPVSEQETLQVNDTELPELLETHIRAKTIYDTLLQKHATNQRYLNIMKQKLASSK